MTKTLVLTNDFPTRQGGIETFVSALADRFPVDEVVVYTARMPGDRAYDATRPYPVVRDRAGTLLPTRRLRKAVVQTMREHGCDRVLLGASAPLGLLARSLRAAGAQRIVAITHGHEVWWARLPGTRRALRRIGYDVDVLTYISGWCHDRIAQALRPGDRHKMRRLAPGVDITEFRPGVGGAQVRAEHGIGEHDPVVLCVGRLVPRKGQDQLIRVWPRVLADHPTARLLLVGRGPHHDALAAQIRRAELETSVTLVGSVSGERLPGYFDAADVFAMPSRDRLRGLEVEGLGIVYFEAAACEKPVVVGRSGGAPDAVADGETGVIVDPLDPGEIAGGILGLLNDPGRAREMGRAGRRRAAAHWTWDAITERCREYLGVAGSA